MADVGFGLLGYFFLKIGWEPAPFVLGFVLGPMLEKNFRRAMLIASGDFFVFLERPISAVLLGLSVLLLAALLVPEIPAQARSARGRLMHLPPFSEILRLPTLRRSLKKKRILQNCARKPPAEAEGLCHADPSCGRLRKFLARPVGLDHRCHGLGVLPSLSWGGVGGGGRC